MIIKRFSECQEELIMLGSKTTEKILRAVEGYPCEEEVKKILTESTERMRDKAEECQKEYSFFGFRKNIKKPQPLNNYRLVNSGKADKEAISQSILEYENQYPEISVIKGMTKEDLKKKIRVKYDKDFDSWSAELPGASGWWDFSVDREGNGSISSYND